MRKQAAQTQPPLCNQIAQRPPPRPGFTHKLKQHDLETTTTWPSTLNNTVPCSSGCILTVLRTALKSSAIPFHALHGRPCRNERMTSSADGNVRCSRMRRRELFWMRPDEGARCQTRIGGPAELGAADWSWGPRCPRCRMAHGSELRARTRIGAGLGGTRIGAGPVAGARRRVKATAGARDRERRRAPLRRRPPDRERRAPTQGALRAPTQSAGPRPKQGRKRTAGATESTGPAHGPAEPSRRKERRAPTQGVLGPDGAPGPDIQMDRRTSTFRWRAGPRRKKRRAPTQSAGPRHKER